MYKRNRILILLVFCMIFSRCFNNRSIDIMTKLESGIYQNEKFRNSLSYRLFIPDEINHNERYPLILLLHPGGGQGNDNVSQYFFAVNVFISDKIQNIQKCFVFVPQCPEKSQWVNTKNITTPFKNYMQDDIPESEAMKMIIRIIDKLEKEYPIDKERIYVSGISMGGSGTWDIITRHPDMFAAAVVVNGVNDPGKAHIINNMPVWAFHGVVDRISSVENTRSMIRALKGTGNSKVKYTEYFSKGHNIEKTVYSNSDMVEWLFAQKNQE